MPRGRKHRRGPTAWLPGSSVILEAGSDTVRAILIEEGRSQNGTTWTRAALEDIVEAADGVPVNLYDFSARGDGSALNHWEALRLRLPPAIRELLPSRLAGAQSAIVRNPVLEETRPRARVVADLELEPDRAPLVRRLIAAAKRVGRQVGLSIHVPPEGMTTALKRFGRKITSVESIVGFDIVTQPSAGGRIVPVLEALAIRRSRPMKDFLAKLLRLCPEDQRPALEAIMPKDVETAEALLEDANEDFAEKLLKALDLGDLEDEQLPAVLEALAKRAPDAPKKTTKKRSAKKTSSRRRRRADDDPEDDDDDDEPALEAISDAQKKTDERVAGILLDAGETLLEARLTDAKLPGKLGKFAKSQLGAILESNGSITRKEIDDFISDLKKGIGADQATGGSLLESVQTVPHYSQPWSSGEAVVAALDAMLSGDREGVIFDKDDPKKEVGRVPAFTGPRQLWAVCMDDPMCEGLPAIQRRRGVLSPALESIGAAGLWDSNDYMQRLFALKGGGSGAPALEAIITTGFTALLADQMNKRLAREYNQLAHLWKMIASTTSVSDFRNRRIVRMGEYSNLSVVAEDAAYSPGSNLTDFTEESVQSAVVKHGGIAFISWESIVNDDLRGFRMIPKKLARAAERTLNASVWGILLNNTILWDVDSTVVFTAGHLNTAAVAYTFAQLEVARRNMTQHKDRDLREAGRVIARNVFCGPVMYDTVYADLFSDGHPNLAFSGTVDRVAAAAQPRADSQQSPQRANPLRSKHGWQLFEVHEFDEVGASANDVIVAASPGEAEMIEVAFLNGREDPEIFVQDLERVGSFFDQDRITYKVRHVHDDGELVDYRPFYRIANP